MTSLSLDPLPSVPAVLQCLEQQRDMLELSFIVAGTDKLIFWPNFAVFDVYLDYQYLDYLLLQLFHLLSLQHFVWLTGYFILPLSFGFSVVAAGYWKNLYLYFCCPFFLPLYLSCVDFFWDYNKLKAAVWILFILYQYSIAVAKYFFLTWKVSVWISLKYQVRWY